MAKNELNINQSTGINVTKTVVNAVRFNRAQDGSLHCWCIETTRFDSAGNEIDSALCMDDTQDNLDWILDNPRSYADIIAKAEAIVVARWG